MSKNETGIADFLAAHVEATKPRDVSASTRERVAEHVMDTVGVALAASGEPPGRIVVGLFDPERRGDGCRIIGTAKRAETWDAAWANGSLGHLLDFDDIANHPTTCVLPAVLAIGEKRGSSGEDLLVAMTVGYEVFERIVVAFEPFELRFKVRGIHPMCICGAVGAAAAAGKLLGLDKDQLAVAIGLAASSSFGLIEQFGSWGKGLQAGNVARAGVMAVLLAEQDYFGSRTALDGKQGLYNATVGAGNYDLELARTEWGKTWYIDEPGVPLKPVPVCGGGQRPASAAVQLRRESIPDPALIERVGVTITDGLMKTLRVDRPARGFEGKFCLRFIVAAGLLDGRIDIDTFSDESFDRPAMQDMLRRVEVTVLEGGYDDPDLRKRTPIKVFLKDGSVVEKEEWNPRGGLNNRMSHAEVVEKYTTNARRVLGEDQVRRSVALLEDLASTSVRELLDSVTIPAAGR